MLAMEIQWFENFDLHSKACITWSKGVHIGYRSCGKYYMSLYRLHHFYVEVQYHTCHDGIACIKTFSCEDELQPYLDQIDLSIIL
jgi:hypothetical protein